MINQKACKSPNYKELPTGRLVFYATSFMQQGSKKLKFTAGNFSRTKLQNSAYISTDIISDIWQQLCVVISKNKSFKKTHTHETKKLQIQGNKNQFQKIGKTRTRPPHLEIPHLHTKNHVVSCPKQLKIKVSAIKLCKYLLLRMEKINVLPYSSFLH